ncbi:uncharacterized protein EV420DRAFT_1331510 [Desarmillaria tabescens]|uniref:Oxidoreductase-like domain-containing protein n=1 Tax=Armillaria tabescens TaxID=1929756 RepID=A0AA39TNP9_ARMTA|nr:uncharacterized protein EV420DRAFT_1331510 [Desarmillaria tabescens]KAK0461143.1 hypothetical protein EV420DRAFT_1331510 [Desarmillaria tabescens]
MSTYFLSCLPRHRSRAIDLPRCISTATGRKRTIGHGQNLSARYARLEKSLREKQALQGDLDELSSSSLTVPEEARKKKRQQNTFKGLVIPELPRAPESDECCMSGCAVCVYDLYEESMKAYKENVATLRNALVSMGVPENEWPASVKSPTEKVERKSNVVLSVFEEMERALKEKQKSSAPSRQTS